jgi:hypothetical protein
MIARRIDRKAHNDNYRALALYIADAGHGGEKALMSWCAGGLDDQYRSAIVETEATQALNTRSAKTKTYHLLVSFRPEDEATLTPDIFKGMERDFAQALGFSEHQRHAGVHKNTNNIHFHVAYNMIDSATFRRHEPFRDFKILSRVCQELEAKYGLTVDHGLEPAEALAEPQPKPRVKAIEIQTGQETLFSYIQRHKPELMAGLDSAKTWAELHAAFLKPGLLIKPRGNGLVISDRFGKHSAKASEIDKSLSKAGLEKKFGLFEAPNRILEEMKSDTAYTAAPLQIRADRGHLYELIRGRQKAASGRAYACQRTGAENIWSPPEPVG